LYQVTGFHETWCECHAIGGNPNLLLFVRYEADCCKPDLSAATAMSRARESFVKYPPIGEAFADSRQGVIL